MASEMLQRGDLTAYIVAGLPKSFVSKLKKYVQEQSEKGEVMQLDPEMTDWVVAKLRGEKRRAHERTPASAALWRAYRALSAARFHLQDRPQEEQVRELRGLVENLWRELSPQFETVVEGPAVQGESDQDDDDEE